MVRTVPGARADEDDAGWTRQTTREYGPDDAPTEAERDDAGGIFSRPMVALFLLLLGLIFVGECQMALAGRRASHRASIGETHGHAVARPAAANGP